MNSRRIDYTPHPDATPETELSALAAAYRFILERRAKKKATCPGGPDDAEDLENDRTAAEIILE
jgi:hypothetical protein